MPECYVCEDFYEEEDDSEFLIFHDGRTYCHDCYDNLSLTTPQPTSAICGCGSTTPCGSSGCEHPGMGHSSIMRYNADVRQYFPDFYKLPKENNPVYTGIELELAWKVVSSERQPILDDLYKELGYCIFKHDGSLDDGFEIVTAPASMAFHKVAWKKVLPKLRASVRSWNASSQQCGIHIHVDRKAFFGPSVKAHEYKWATFINTPRNNDFIATIAGRDIRGSRWCSAQDRYNFANPVGENGKYSAINFDKGPTLECRIFRGNIATLGFMKNLEFIYASLEFSREVGISHNSLSYTEFLKWLHKHENKYYYLCYFLNQKNYAKYPTAVKRFIAETDLSLED